MKELKRAAISILTDEVVRLEDENKRLRRTLIMVRDIDIVRKHTGKRGMSEAMREQIENVLKSC